MQLTDSEVQQISDILAAARAREGAPVLSAEDVRNVGRSISLSTPEQIGMFWQQNIGLTVEKAFNHGVYLMGEHIIEAGGLEPEQDIAWQAENPDEAPGPVVPHPASCDGCGHASDCSTHNEPALPVGPCDCGPNEACSSCPKR